MRLLLPVLILCAVAAFAACGGDDSDGGSSSTPTAGVTRAATATALPDPTDDLEETLVPLPAGVYTSKTFAPRASVTVPEGWSLAADTATDLAFEHESAFAEEQAYVVFFRVTNIRSQANFSTPEASPDDLIGWMVNHRDLDITDGPKDVTIDGYTGRQIDVNVDTEYLVPLFDEFEAHPRDRFRVTQVDVNGERVIVVSGAFSAGAFDAVQPLLEPVVASIAFE